MNIGKILALLSLKARSPEVGLDQEEIKVLTKLSLSTISRALNKAVDLKYCAFEERQMYKGISVKKYYVKKSFKDIVLDRMNKTLEECLFLQEKLSSYENKIMEAELEANKDLLEHVERLDVQNNQVIKFTRKIIDQSKEFFKD